jgi:hypothetical protein
MFPSMSMGTSCVHYMTLFGVVYLFTLCLHAYLHAQFIFILACQSLISAALPPLSGYSICYSAGPLSSARRSGLQDFDTNTMDSCLGRVQKGTGEHASSTCFHCCSLPVWCSWQTAEWSWYAAVYQYMDTALGTT